MLFASTIWNCSQPTMVNDLMSCSWEKHWCMLFLTLKSSIALLMSLKRTSRWQWSPEWQASTCHGFYVGHSDLHSSSIALIWNPIMKLVSVQYHIVFDEGFQTVSSLGSTFDHATVKSTFGMLLENTDWMYSDTFAKTSPISTHHYYFDNN